MLRRIFALAIFSGIVVSAEVPPFAAADSLVSPRIALLRKQVEAGIGTATAQFWTEIATNHAPLIEVNPLDHRSSLVTFVWQAKKETHNVVIVGAMAGFDFTSNQMARLDTTDVWYKTYTIRNDARFAYQLSPNDSLQPVEKLNPKDIAGGIQRLFLTPQPDPLNPRIFRWRLGQFSWVELPAAPPQPWWNAPVYGALKGTVEQRKLRSNIPNNERTVWVYTPPGSTSKGEPYPLLVMLEVKTT